VIYFNITTPQMMQFPEATSINQTCTTLPTSLFSAVFFFLAAGGRSICVWSFLTSPAVISVDVTSVCVGSSHWDSAHNSYVYWSLRISCTSPKYKRMRFLLLLWRAHEAVTKHRYIRDKEFQKVYVVLKYIHNITNITDFNKMMLIFCFAFRKWCM